jgi:hypothetical protein
MILTYGDDICTLERFAFYDQARTCFAVVQTLERRSFANVMLQKRMIGPIMDKISSRKKVLGLLCPLLSSRQAIYTTTNEKNIGDDKTKSEKGSAPAHDKCSRKASRRIKQD